MTCWHLGRLAILDIESTAPGPEEARIVTLCTGLVGNGELPDIRQTLVNPGIPIPPEATAIHGITDEMAAGGIKPDAAADLAEKWLAGVWSEGLPVVAYNATYDLTVIDRECRRHLGYGIEINGPVIDPFVIDREIEKYRKGSRNLAATAEFYAVALNGAHDSTEDALAAGRIAWRIGQRNPRIAGMSLEALHEAQAMWHRARQADYVAYLLREGKPADDVCGDWPLRALVAA